MEPQLPQLPQLSFLNARPPSKYGFRSSLACIPCRSRHVKCDAQPVCARCRSEEKQCVYAKSRRGGKRRLSSSTGQDSRPRSSSGSTAVGSITSGSPYVALPSHLSLPQTQQTQQCQDRDSTYENPSASASGSSPASGPAARQQEKFLGLYYEFYHDAHPLALPRTKLEARMQADPESLRYLIPVMEYIGSVYSADGSSDALRQLAHDALTHGGPLPLDGFTVLALLLFALSVHFCDDHSAADALLDKASEIALSIRMFRRPFAQANGESDLVLEESWRRTAWGLFLTDAVFAAIAHRSTHRLQTVTIDVELPCEDQEYEAGDIPLPRTLADYDNREFDDDGTVYSSFAYFIDVGRILSSTLCLAQDPKESMAREFDAAATKIVNWFLYLPNCKQVVLKSEGKVDEVMLLSHLWINIQSLILHRPQSLLKYSSIETNSSCTPVQQIHKAEKSAILHTTKALEAIEATFKLYPLPSLYLKHSPIIACSMALAIMAQASACTYMFEKGSTVYQESRERIRMGLGVLRSHSDYWGGAKRSLREVKEVGKHLLADQSVQGAEQESTGVSVGVVYQGIQIRVRRSKS